MIVAALTFTLASATFKPNAVIPMSAVKCGGSNISPELHWSGAPAGTRSFALVTHDPDAPHPGGWYHWVVYNLPPDTHELPANAAIPMAELGTTSFGTPGYGGPCPPPGKPHHYHFTLYALNERPILERGLTGPQLEAAISSHVLAKTTLTGMYGVARH